MRVLDVLPSSRPVKRRPSRRQSECARYSSRVTVANRWLADLESSLDREKSLALKQPTRTILLDHSRTLLRLMILYAVASLVHFVHNALYIHTYPNLPVWITPFGVYASWAGITAIGVLGYWLYQKVSRVNGHLVVALYALLGFGGLDHYAITPVGAHTVAMNVTILAEVSAAAIVLSFVAYSYLYGRRV